MGREIRRYTDRETSAEKQIGGYGQRNMKDHKEGDIRRDRVGDMGREIRRHIERESCGLL